MGAYAINNSFFDVGVMLVMDIVGYVFEANDMPVAPVVLGLVLGPIVGQNFMVSMIKTSGTCPSSSPAPRAPSWACSPSQPGCCRSPRSSSAARAGAEPA